MSGPIVLTTDFGLQDHYVGVMKGVIASIAPTTRVIDLCHAIPPQDVARAAYTAAVSLEYFTVRHVQVVVVDPGVGSARRAVAVEVAGNLLVAPDNGLLGWVLDFLHDERGLATGAPDGEWWRLDAGVRAVALENPAWWRTARPSQTFHGRDVFAPVAAHLANGVALGALGPPIDRLLLLPRAKPSRDGRGWRGEILHADRFGNLVTNLRRQHCPDDWTITIAGHLIQCLSASFTAMQGLGAILGSDGYLEIAAPGGSAAALLGAGTGTPVVVQPAARPAAAPDQLAPGIEVSGSIRQRCDGEHTARGRLEG